MALSGSESVRVKDSHEDRKQDGYSNACDNAHYGFHFWLFLVDRD